MRTILPIIEILALGVPILLLLLRTVPAKERPRLARLLFIGFGLRLFVAAFFDLVPAARIFHEDAEGYETYGQVIAAHWWGDGPPLLLPGLSGDARVNYSGYLLFCSALYYVLGRFPLVVTAVTSLCGVISIFMVYRLAGRIFRPLVAYRAALLTAYFPSMILWSAMALKDPLMIMLIVIALDSALSLRESFQVRALVLLVVAALAMWFVRFYVVYFLALATLTSLVIARGRSMLGTLSRQLMVAGVLVVTLSALGATSGMINAAEPFGLDRISSYRHGMATTANSGFSADADVSTASGALAFLPVGLSVLLFGPFPWQMISLRPLIALPEMLVWWSMVPALFRGLRFAIRREPGSTMPIMVFGATLTGLYALTLGNVGAAFRQRAQVFVFLFIFAALGHYVRRCRRMGIDPDELRVNSRG